MGVGSVGVAAGGKDVGVGSGVGVGAGETLSKTARTSLSPSTVTSASGELPSPAGVQRVNFHPSSALASSWTLAPTGYLPVESGRGLATILPASGGSARRITWYLGVGVGAAIGVCVGVAVGVGTDVGMAVGVGEGVAEGEGVGV